MNDLIASTLFQNRTCTLPGIGTLNIITRAAQADFVSAQIKAPVQTIAFTPSINENIFNEFSALSVLLMKHLEESGELKLEGIGTFTKDEQGTIQFTPEEVDELFSQPVSAVRIIREDAAHAILVGDKETTSTEMTEFFNETPHQKSRWWIWAAVLGLVGSGVVIYYLVQNGFNLLGNMADF